MSLEVHFLDRRNGLTIVRNLDHTWYGPFAWEDGSFSCDCNRSLLMYPEQSFMHTGCSGHIIVVGKIFHKNELLYEEYL